MSTRYIVPLPKGGRKEIYYNSENDKTELVQSLLLDQWEDYCLANWPTHGKRSATSPEQGVERFLDGCASLILQGNTQGTVTRYKSIMNGKREIPVSSCPTEVDYLLNAGKVSSPWNVKEEAVQFSLMLERQDEYAKQYERKGKRAARGCLKESERSRRIRQIKQELGPCTFLHCRVDTDNVFCAGGNRYQIASSVDVYKPKQTKEGLLYDMDYVIAVFAGLQDPQFYDQSYAPIPNSVIRFIWGLEEAPQSGA